MGDNKHPGGGDVIGYSNRAFVLKLLGGNDGKVTAPYRLAARLNVNDGIETAPIIEGDRWYHVALTVESKTTPRQIRLFVNGKQVAEGATQK